MVFVCDTNTGKLSVKFFAGNIINHTYLPTPVMDFLRFGRIE